MLISSEYWIYYHLILSVEKRNKSVGVTARYAVYNTIAAQNNDVALISEFDLQDVFEG